MSTLTMFFMVVDIETTIYSCFACSLGFTRRRRGRWRPLPRTWQWWAALRASSGPSPFYRIYQQELLTYSCVVHGRVGKMTSRCGGFEDILFDLEHSKNHLGHIVLVKKELSVFTRALLFFWVLGIYTSFLFCSWCHFSHPAMDHIASWNPPDHGKT